MLGFFPDRQFANVDERKKALKLRHLLGMTSGLQWDEPLSGFPKDFLAMEASPDWVKFGRFWLHDGVLGDKRLMPAGWLDAVRNATLATDLSPAWTYAN